MAISVYVYSLASASETQIVPVDSGKVESGYVYLNGVPIKENEVIEVNEANQDEIIAKYGIEKPSEGAQLKTIRVVNNDPRGAREFLQENNDTVNPQNIWGFKLTKGTPQFIDGWTEIARGKHFCTKPKGQSCNRVEISVSANESVAVEVQSSLSVGVKEFVAAEFGRSLNETGGVSTSVMVPMDIPGQKTGIVIGYPIYKSTFCQVYQKGIFSDTYLGGASMLEPSKSSIVTMDWIQG
ncbi:hypothetical protein HP548_23675 [Paenibacillus taichungensis]|uniref:Uncharacterized protein n=1 Tax=Paenibacillus taichungensis TaxID=484184 RepID=A0ABX2MSS4_9BACL|nr:hypothetical protein [Paenibacillus taichungensis]NUU57085.1 hypothetical protein [Paenibacillus taichungensis]